MPTFPQRVIALMKKFQADNNKSPNVICISRADEHELALDAPDPLKSEITVHGVRSMSTFHGMRIEWDAEETSVGWEEPLPSILFG